MRVFIKYKLSSTIRSFRIGAAAAAAAAAAAGGGGLPARLIKVLGRWNSDTYLT